MTSTHREDYAAVLAGIHDDFQQRLAALAADPQHWSRFCEQAATFGARYSLGNQMLLAGQAEQRGIVPQWFLPYGRKDATTGWRAHRRWVRAGEKAYRVWAPLRRRPTEHQARAREAAGHRVAREPSGRPAVQLVGFRLAHTFELSQTDGEPFEVPTVLHRRRRSIPAAQLLTGDDPTGVHDDLVALITDAGYSYQLVAPGGGHLGTAHGVTVTRPGLRLVQVRADVDAAQRTKTTMHELAHIRCGHPGTAEADMHRGRAETEAESIAHIVLRALGLDSGAYSDAYVLGWADGDVSLIKDCAETVLCVARQILQDLAPAQPDTGGELTGVADPAAGPPPDDPDWSANRGGAHSTAGPAAPHDF